jgi:hypothetical protein
MFLINYQAGILIFLIFFFIVFYILLRYLKEKAIDKNDILFLSIFIMPCIFYTLIPIKNTTVTTPLLIPFSFIIAKGTLQFPKKLKYLLLFFLIINGFFYILPFGNLNRTISFDLSPYPFFADIEQDFYQEKLILFSRRNDISTFFSKHSRFQIVKNEKAIKEISNIITSISSLKEIKKIDILFMYSDCSISPATLHYHLINPSESNYRYSSVSAIYYRNLNILKENNVSLDAKENNFSWVYNFDFVIIPKINKLNQIINNNHTEYYDKYANNSIFLYISNSEEFKKRFRLIYQKNIFNSQFKDYISLEIYENILSK